MSDPVDPVKGLRKGDVKSRAAAARALVEAADWDALEPLVHAAKTDKSPSVRLYAAAAAADIAARHRGAAGQQAMSQAQADQVFEWLKGVDPVQNPSLVLLLGALKPTRGLKRLGRILRDPRNIVRTAGAAGLRRMALSGASGTDEAIAEAVGGWMDAGRLAPDMVLELIHLVGECGWSGFESRLQKAAGAGRPHVAATEQALARLAARRDLAGWDGVWASEGRDVLEPGGKGTIEWFLIAESKWLRPVAGAAPGDLTLDGVGARVGGDRVRRVYAPIVGSQEQGEALQVQGFTYWRKTAKELVEEVESMMDGVALIGEGAAVIADWVLEVDGTLAQRAAALLRWRAGKVAGARELLEQLTAHKRPRNDLFWWLARIQVDDGDAAGARRSLDRYLGKASKKDPYLAEAQALLASLDA